MKLVRIFVDDITHEGLYAMLHDGQSINEFDRLLELWDDLIYLRDYFNRNKAYLDDPFFKGITVKQASNKVVNEAYNLAKELDEYSELEFTTGMNSLQMLFRPLNTGEERKFVIPSLQKSKAKSESDGKPNMIRFYSIRVGQNSFVISGGAIKLTERMEDHPDTNAELLKLAVAKQWLQDNHITSQEELILYYE